MGECFYCFSSKAAAGNSPGGRAGSRGREAERSREVQLRLDAGTAILRAVEASKAKAKVCCISGSDCAHAWTAAAAKQIHADNHP